MFMIEHNTVELIVDTTLVELRTSATRVVEVLVDLK